MAYNYTEALENDIREFIRHEWDGEVEYDALYDALFDEDAVTGNASGSYTFSTWEAEENLCHNWDLLVDAAEHFGEDPVIDTGWKHGAEWWDVTIRCYLLEYVLRDVLEDISTEEE